MTAKFFPALVIALALAVANFAQSPPKAISTATRQVTMCSELENKLATAFEKRDSAALENMLADDFEVWSPRPSGDPIARDEWLQLAPELRSQSFRIRNMAVRTFGQLYIVSFVVNQTIAGAQQSHFIVDVWDGTGESAKLQARYESPEPGKANGPEASPAKPTGKD